MEGGDGSEDWSLARGWMPMRNASAFSFVAQSHNRNSVILRGGIRLGSGLTGVLINANERKTQTTHTW